MADVTIKRSEAYEELPERLHISGRDYPLENAKRETHACWVLHADEDSRKVLEYVTPKTWISWGNTYSEYVRLDVYEKQQKRVEILEEVMVQAVRALGADLPSSVAVPLRAALEKLRALGAEGVSDGIVAADQGSV